MRNLFKLLTIVFISLALVSVPLSATAQSIVQDHKAKEAATMAADALLVRPLGIAATVLGFGLFVISVPFSALGGNVPEAWNAMVARPAVFTFARPLGDLD